MFPLCFFNTDFYANQQSWDINGILIIYFTVSYSLLYFNKNKWILIILKFIISTVLKSFFDLVASVPWYPPFLPSKNQQPKRPGGLAPKMTKYQAWLAC